MNTPITPHFYAVHIYEPEPWGSRDPNWYHYFYGTQPCTDGVTYTHLVAQLPKSHSLRAAAHLACNLLTPGTWYPAYIKREGSFIFSNPDTGKLRRFVINELLSKVHFIHVHEERVELNKLYKRELPEDMELLVHFINHAHSVQIVNLNTQRS